MNLHLIFEGPELSGKSYLISRIYPILEPKHASSNNILEGCFWINSDIGILGTQWGKQIVDKYVEMAEILKEKPILFEKLHISDKVYGQLFKGEILDYKKTEERLERMNFKIVFTTFREDLELIKKRLKERISLYPHYARIAKPPDFYIKQQNLYRQMLKSSSLPILEVDLSDFPPDSYRKVIDWASN